MKPSECTTKVQCWLALVLSVSPGGSPRSATTLGWWQNDRKEGWGEMVWKSGSHYQGEWKSGLRDGFGVHTFHNADKYPIPFLSAQRSSSNF